MASIIYFVGGGGENALAVRVNEDPSQVQDALESGHGDSVCLTTRQDDEVWINPRNIAYWKKPASGGIAGL